MDAVSEPAVSRARWLAATLVGLGVWAAVVFVTGPVLVNSPINPLVSLAVAVLPGIYVAGRVVGARSARRWIIVGLLTSGLILAVTAGLMAAFLQSGFLNAG